MIYGQPVPKCVLASVLMSQILFLTSPLRCRKSFWVIKVLLTRLRKITKVLGTKGLNYDPTLPSLVHLAPTVSSNRKDL